jgi:hypothetical protein
LAAFFATVFLPAMAPARFFIGFLAGALVSVASGVSSSVFASLAIPYIAFASFGAEGAAFDAAFGFGSGALAVFASARELFESAAVVVVVVGFESAELAVASGPGPPGAYVPL